MEERRAISFWQVLVKFGATVVCGNGLCDWGMLRFRVL